jgi:hypothetical protein
MATKQPKQFKIIRWFDLVRDSARLAPEHDNDHPLQPLIDAVMGAAEYYLSAKLDADNHIIPVGKLQNLLAETTGLAYFYNGIHTDALQVRKWLEILQEGTKSEKYVWFTTHPDAKIEYGKMTPTEVNNHIKADDSVQLLADMIRVIADRQHILENVRESFVNRSIMLSKIVDMRVAGLEEVWVNGLRETRND